MCIFLFLTFTCLVRFAPVWEQVIRKYEVTFIIREREFLIIILQMLRYADVAKDVQVCRRGEVWRCAGVQMWRCAGVQMWRCADMEMWRCAGVEMCRCGDVQLCADVKEVKMRKKWRCEGSEDVKEVKMCRGEGTKTKSATDIQHGSTQQFKIQGRSGPTYAKIHPRVGWYVSGVGYAWTWINVILLSPWNCIIYLLHYIWGDR